MTFAEMLVRLARWGKAHGIVEVVFRWNLRGWSPLAPNGGRRWSIELWGRDGKRSTMGTGAVGQEALEETLAKIGV